MELSGLGAEIFERGCGGASGNLGQRHELRDGGQLALVGGVVTGSGDGSVAGR